MDKNLDKELGQILSRVFLLQQVPPPNLDKELGQLQAALLLYTWSQPGIEAFLPHHLPGIGAAPARRVIRIIRIIRSYGDSGRATRWHRSLPAAPPARNWSLHPGAPPARHRSLGRPPCCPGIVILHRRPLPSHLPGIEASTRPRHLPSIGASAAAPRSQSCGQRRIAPLNPVANAVLLHSILRPTQDCSTQSCGQRRIAPLNPVANAGLRKLCERLAI